MLLGGWYDEDVSQNRGSGRRSQVAGALAQVLLVEKGAPNLYSDFLRGGGLQMHKWSRRFNIFHYRIGLDGRKFQIGALGTLGIDVRAVSGGWGGAL
jgi:hypothetical protein